MIHALAYALASATWGRAPWWVVQLACAIENRTRPVPPSEPVAWPWDRQEIA